MLEGVVATVLSRFLGDFVQGLEKDNLKLSLTGGEVRLQNLALRKEALSNLQLPIVVKEGFLGKLELNIPWKNLGSQPAIIRLDRIYLVAGPAKIGDEDPAALEEKLQNTKQKRLMIAELLGGSDDKDEDKPKQTGKQEDQGFAARWIAKIVDNLQIFVDRVHIRYEDDRTCPSSPFVFGITLESLHAQSTTENWEPSFLNSSPTLVHKLVSLKNLTVYWDSSATFIDAVDLDDFSEQMDMLTHQDYQNLPPRHHYLLRPINSELKVILNKDDSNLNIPKISLDFMFQQVAFALQENQFGEIMDTIDSFALYQRGAMFRKFRPTVPVASNPTAWWKFAVDATVMNTREKKRVWSMDYIRQAIQDRKKYILLYTKKKQHEYQKITLPQEVEAELNEMEKRLNYDQIISFRQLANVFVKKERALLEASGKNTKGGGWFSSWFRSNTLETSGMELTEEVMKELYTIVDSEESKKETPSIIPKEYVKVGIKFRLEEGSLEVKTSSKDQESMQLAQAVFKGFDINVAVRDGSMSFDGTLKTADVFDYFTPKTRFPALITPVWTGKQQQEGEHFLGVKFDLNPLDDQNADFRLKLNMRPLEVVFNMILVNRIVKFFTGQKESPALRNLQQEAIRQFDALQKQSFESLTWTLQNKKVMDIHIEASAPSIIIPQSFTEEDCNMLVIDLGHLSVNTRLNGDEKERLKVLSQLRPGDIVKYGAEAKEEDFYDRFFLGLASLQALIAHKTDDWRAFGPDKRKSAQIIEKFDLELCLQLCLVPSDVLTKVKVSGKLPSLKLNISDNRCKELFKTLKAVLDSLADDTQKQAATKSVPLTASGAPAHPKKNHPAQPLQLNTEEEKQREQQQRVLMEKKVVELYFAIPEIQLFVTQETEGVAEDSLAALSLQHIMVTVVKRTFDMTAVVVLHDVVVEDFYQKWGNRFKYLLSSDLSESSDPFLQLAFRSVSKESPEYASIDSDLDLRVGDIGVMCNRETLVALLHFVNRNILDQLANERKDSTAVVAHDNAKLQEPKQEGSAIRINARIGVAKLELNKDGNVLADLQLDQSTIKLAISPKGTITINGKLGSITVKDENKENLYYSEVVSIQNTSENEAKQLVTFSFNTYDANDAASYPGYDMGVQMQISSVGLVFVQPFFKDVLLYLTEIKDMQMILAKSAAAAAEGAKQAAQAVLNPTEENEAEGKEGKSEQKPLGKLFSFDIAVSNPHVIIPRHRQSDDILVLNLGNIHLFNQFDRVAGGGKEDSVDVFENILLSIKELNLQATHLKSLTQGERQGSDETESRYAKVIRDIDIDIKLERALQNIAHDFVDQRITISVPNINFVLVERQAHYLLSVVGDNLAALFAEDGMLEVLKNLGKSVDQIEEEKALKEKEEKEKELSVKDKPRADASVWTTMDVQVLLGKISLDILRGDGILREVRPGVEVVAGVPVQESDMHEAGNDTLASLIVRHLRVQFAQKSDSSMSCGVEIDDMEVNDTRPGKKNMFKQLVGHFQDKDITAPPKASKLVVVKYEKEQPSERQSISVNIDRPRVYAIPEPLLALKDMVLPLLDSVNKTLASMNPSGKADEQQPKQDQPKIEQNKEGLVAPVGLKGSQGPMSLRLLITNPEICVLEDPSREDSRGLMVRSKIDVSFLALDPKVGGGQKVRVLVRSFECCKRRFSYNEFKMGWSFASLNKDTGVRASTVFELEDKETEVALVEPLDLSLSYSQVYFPAEMCEIAVEIQRVYVTLSIQDYKLLMSIADKWLALFPKQVEDATETAETAIAETLKEGGTLVRTKSEIDIAQENLEREKEIEKQQEEARMQELAVLAREVSTVTLDVTKQALQVLSGGIIINFVNDFMGQNTPLLEFEVAQSKITVSDWSNRLSAFIDMLMHANYYNAKTENWEPMIEPWHFLLKFGKHRKGQRINLRADQMLELNVTRAFVETVMNTLEVWNDQSFDQLKMTSQVYYPYFIRNDTGQPLRYWLSTEAGTILDLQPGEEQPLPIAAKPAKIRRIDQTKKHVEDALLSIQVEDMKPIRDITIYEFGTEQLICPPFQLLKHVVYHNGSKLIKLQSPIKVRNRNRCPIEVLIEDDTEQSPTNLYIAPKAEAYIPLTLSANSRLYFKPILEETPKSSHKLLGATRKVKTKRYEEFLLSSAIGTPKFTKQKLYSSKLSRLSGMMTCASESDSSRSEPFQASFSFRVDIDRDRHQIKSEEGAPSEATEKEAGTLSFSSAKPRSSIKRHVIELFPPFVLENLLASDMEFKVLVNDRRKDVEVMKGHIAKGDKVNVHAFEDERGLSVSIRIPGFVWTDPIPIKNNVPDFVDIKDKEKRPLRVNVHEKIRTSGVHMISFWCDYWMINKTGLRVLYKQETTLSYVPLSAGQYSNTPIYTTEKIIASPSADVFGNNNLLMSGKTETKNNWDSALEKSTEDIWDLKGEPRDWYYEDYQELYQQPFMLAFAHSGLTAPKVQLRIANSVWSDGLTLSAQNTLGTIEVAERESTKLSRVFVLGLESAAAEGKFWRTKCITIVPCFIFVNSLSCSLFVNQIGTNEIFSILPGECLPFHWYARKEGRQLRVRLDDAAYDWSGAFEVQLCRTESLKLHRKDVAESDTQKRHFLLRVESKSEGAKNFVFFRDESTKYPKYLIDNKANETLVIRQKGDRLDKKWITVPPFSSVPFAWDEPMLEEKKLLLRISNTNVEREYDIDHFFDSKPIVIAKSKYREAREILISTEASGPTRVLLIMDKASKDRKLRKKEQEKFGAGERVRAGQKGRNTTGKLDEDEELSTEINLSFAGVGLSLVDDQPQELLYVSLQQINVDLVLSDINQYFEVTISKAQADNMLYSTIYPIMIFPVAQEVKSEEDAEVGLRSFLHLSIVKRADMEEVDYFEYFGFGVQELDVQVEGEFIARFLEFANVIMSSSFVTQTPMEAKDKIVEIGEEVAEDVKLKEKDLQKEKNLQKELAEKDTKQQYMGLVLFQPTTCNFSSRPLYFGVFHLNPISILLTFTPISGVRSDITISKILNFTGAIENAPIKLNMLGLENAFMLRTDFVERIKAHYTQQALAQVYKVLGSYEFMGSPVSLVSNLGTGVYDFFYEPANGLVKSPLAFGEGLAKGTESLFRNTLTGVFNSTSKITGSISKGAASLSFDADYIKDREMAQRSKPKHALEGISYGVTSFGKGLFQGATGIVVQPIKGAKEEGLAGFAKGVGRGVVGVAAKPVAGTFDLLSQTTEGFRNTATFLDRGTRTRVRCPRYIGSDKVLRPYDSYLAEGKTLLYTVDKGTYKKEDYEFHMKDAKGNTTLLTDEHILYLDGSAEGQCLWSVDMKNFDRAEATDGGLWLFLKQAGSSSLMEFVGGGVNKRFVPCGDRPSTDKLFHQLEKTVADSRLKQQSQNSERTLGFSITQKKTMNK